jgi:transposase-like protein
MAGKRRGRAQWTRLVRQWKTSGQSAKAFAAGHGVNPSTLYWWSRHLNPVAEKRVSFVPVEVAQVASSSLIALELAGVRMHVPVGTDVAYVVSLMTALRQSDARC